MKNTNKKHVKQIKKNTHLKKQKQKNTVFYISSSESLKLNFIIKHFNHGYSALGLEIF